jgi:hypothetical protein
MIEKFYEVDNKEIISEYSFYKDEIKRTNIFIKDFFKQYNIEGMEYYIRGDGSCNTPFKECDKKNIVLYVEKYCNEEKFEEYFCKNTKLYPLVSFKKTSKLLKDFQNKCIKNNIIINLLDFRIGEYFERLQNGGYSSICFIMNGKMFVKISTNKVEILRPTKDGFKEIKGSEFYINLEKYNNKE